MEGNKMEIKNTNEENDREAKLKAIAIEVIEEVQSKGLTLNEMRQLPEFMSHEIRLSVRRQIQDIEFKYIKDKQEPSD